LPAANAVAGGMASRAIIVKIQVRITLFLRGKLIVAGIVPADIDAVCKYR
jgi:hypothetical protein